MYRPLEKRKSGGSPPFKFKTPADLAVAIDQYFNACDKDKRPYTVSGLAYTIGTSRQVLIDYQNRDEYEDIVLDAKRRIERYTEECLFTKQNPAGVIFCLKNNYGYKDKQEIDTTINTNVADALKSARERIAPFSGDTIEYELEE